ncbi:MAG: hypothetical protein ACE5KH_05710 [Candidatus Geothermarchaeales archaeon]
MRLKVRITDIKSERGLVRIFGKRLKGKIPDVQFRPPTLSSPGNLPKMVAHVQKQAQMRGRRDFYLVVTREEYEEMRRPVLGDIYDLAPKKE